MTASLRLVLFALSEPIPPWLSPRLSTDLQLTFSDAVVQEADAKPALRLQRRFKYLALPA